MTINSTQIRTIALLTAGYSSEVLNKSAYILSWAMQYDANGMPLNNSGYSVGVLQSDLGQRQELASSLTKSYYQWAGDDPNRLIGRSSAQLESVLRQQGRYQLVPNANSDDLSKRPLNNEEMAKFNAFLQTDDGRQAVWAADLKQIEKLGNFGDRIIASQTYQSLTNDVERIKVLTSGMKLYNQSESYGNTFLEKLNQRPLTWEQVASAVIDGRPKYIISGFDHVIEGANLYNKIINSTTPLAVWLADLSNQNLSILGQRGFADDPRYQVMERLFRDADAGSKFVDSVAQGNPALMSLPKGLNGEVRIIGVDKSGQIFSADGDGSKFQRYINGGWSSSGGNYSRSELPILKQNTKGRWVLALGSEEVDFGASGDASARININGTNVTLNANSGANYIFHESGDLLAVTAADSHHASIAVLTGINQGDMLSLVVDAAQTSAMWNATLSGLTLSFLPPDSNELAYTLTRTSANTGVKTVTQVEPVRDQLDVVGQKVITSTYANGTQLSSMTEVQTLLGNNGERTVSTDAQQYSNGVLQSHTRNTIVSSTGGLVTNELNVTYNIAGQITQTIATERRPDNTLYTVVRDGQGKTLNTTEVQTYDDGSSFSYKTEGGKNYIQAIDEDGKVSGWKEYKTPAQEQATNAMYSDMAGFVNALRGKDKVNQLLYAAKIGLNYQIANGAQNATILGLNQNHLAGLSAVAGVVAGLRALRSDDTKTQISGAVGLVSSANNLYSLGSTGGESISAGFLSPAQAGALQLVGAAISIANLKHLDEMIDNGQYGSAMATLYGAYVGATAIGTVMAAETVSAGIAEIMAGASAAGPVGLYIAVGAIVLDSMFAEDPPPPPPVGGALFKLDAKGKLVWEYDAQTNDLGRSVLAPHMQAMADKLKTYVQESNKDVIDVDRQYVLLASRLPKVYIQSWPSYTDNGKTNFYFALEQKHPQTGELVYSNVARDDIDSDYAAYTVMPEALVQRWQVATMSGKFGADESKWLTEGQWANGNSALEQQRAKLAKAMDDAQKALTEVKTTKYVQDGEQVMAVSASPQELAAAEQRLKAAMGALQVYDAEHPQNGDTAAREVDATLVAQMQSLKASDPEAYLKAYNKARDEATQQWMKVIALDWDGDGKIAHIAAPARTQTDLVSLQTDGATRFDVDGDGYREVTEWINPSDAMLGIDLDGDGVIGNSRELFNAAATAFDQRGWGSLKYYDSNNDNKIDRSDAVFKLLRLWVDINGDGTAGTMETFTLDMDYVGVDMTKLKASLDAAGQQALATLQQLKVQSIDLSTMKFKLADGSQVQASTEQLKADVLGKQVWVDPTYKNPVVAVELPEGKRQLAQYITFMEDMSVLQELFKPGLTPARKDELEALAIKWGMDPKAKDFEQQVADTRKGGEAMGPAGVQTLIGESDVYVPATAEQHKAELLQQLEQWRVLEGQVASAPDVQAPIWATSSTDTQPFDDGYVVARKVNSGEVKSDAPAASSVAKTDVAWVLPKQLYNLDAVTKGAQQGGLVQQQAVVVSQKVDNTKVPSQTVQVFTAATPSVSLAQANWKGQEDERLSFGYLQLEQDARSILPGAGNTTSLKLLGVREVRHGSVVMDDASGVMRFVGEADYSGSEAGFTYVLADDKGRIIERRVNLALAEVNDAPDVLGETVATVEDVPLVFDAATLLANDRDKEGDRLSIIGIGRVGMGKATLEENGQIRYVPPRDMYGTTDTMEYLVRDARGGVSVGVVKISLRSANDAPTVIGEVIRNAKEDQTLAIDAKLLLANDFDPDVDARTGGAALRITEVSAAVHGHAFLMPDTGDVMFVPEDNFHGKASFVYTVTDSTGLSTKGKAEIEIAAANDGPVATGEVIEMKEDKPLDIDQALLLANDTDEDISAGESQKLDIASVGEAVGGRVSLSNGHVQFTPTANFNGQASFRYIISDGAGGFASATATLKVAAVNDLPVAVNRSFEGAQENTDYKLRASQLLANINDVEDGTKLKLTVDTGTVKGGSVSKSFDAALGEDVYTFKPNAGFYGPATFSYSVSDTQGGSSSAQVTLKVNAAPKAVTRNYSMQEDGQPLRIRASELLAGISDSEDGKSGLTLSVATGQVPGGNVTSAWDAALGETVYTFTPMADMNGNVGFKYSVADKDGGKTEALVNVAIAAVNDAPVYVNGSQFNATGTERGANDLNAAVRIKTAALLAMFSDVDGDAIKVQSVKALDSGLYANGRWINQVADTVTYDAKTDEWVFRAAPNAYGDRRLEVVVADVNGAISKPVTVSVSIKEQNFAPEAVAYWSDKGVEDSGDTNNNWAGVYLLADALLQKCSDADGDVVQLDGITNARMQWGANNFDISVSAIGSSYRFNTPTNSYGEITFSYTVKDGRGGVATQNGKIIVNAVDDAPVLYHEKYFEDYSAAGGGTLGYRLYVTDDTGRTDLNSYNVRFGNAQVSQPKLGEALVTSQYIPISYDEYGYASGGYTRYGPFYDEYGYVSTYQTGRQSDLWITNLWKRGGSWQNENLKIQLTDKTTGQTSNEITVTYTIRSYDPILIDLDQDGLEFLSARQGPSTLDVNGDGVKDKMAWAGAKEAMLVYDYNQDGQVTQFDELSFGSHLKDPNPDLPDLQALARVEFDSNQDGVFDAKDAKWSLFRLWQDKDSDGVVDAGEMQTLAQAGVQSLQLQANVLNRAYGPDVVVRGYTRVQMADGRQLQAGDVQFMQYDPANDLTNAASTSSSQAAIASSITEEEYVKALADLMKSQQVYLTAGSTSFSGGLQDQKTRVGEVYSYVLASDLFAQASGVAGYRVTLSDGKALPSWLSYDAATRTLRGSPGSEQIGDLALKVTALDASGKALSASGAFNLEVSQYNQAPVVYGNMPAQYAAEDQRFSLDVAPNFFLDRDATDKLRFKATLADGKALPSWLKFDAVNLRFEGTPGNADVSQLKITLTAMDAAQASASTTFDLIVQNVNDAPTLVTGLQTFGLRVGQDNAYTLPLEAFTDVDKGDSLTLSVTQADGTALPSWMSYTTLTRQLRANPTAAQAMQPLQLKVTATDTSGAKVSTLLTVAAGQWGTAGADKLIGGAASEFIWAEAGNDTLDGGAGADTLIGGTGDDVYLADALDTLVEKSDEGTDEVRTSVAWQLGDNFENLTLTGTSAINGTGNALNNVLVGNSAANVLDGGAGNDKLDGGAGNDTLDGGAGADTLKGGAGDDTYVVDNAGDVVVENASEGTDTVNASVSYSLADNVENLTLTGSTAINGTGNALNNVLVGNSAANVLDGGAGNDTLDGGGGSDYLKGGIGSDVYLFARNFGNDTIEDVDATAGNMDALYFDSSISSNGVSVARMGDSLTLAVAAGGGQLEVKNWFLGSNYQIETVKFGDGVVWTAAALSMKATVFDVMDNANAAVGINIGGSYIESIATAGDHDWYRVTLQAGISYQIEQVKQGSSSIDSYLRLRSATGSQLAYDDDSGGNFNSKLMFTPTSSGTYYLDAGGYNNTSTGLYAISVVHREIGTAAADVLAGTVGADQFEGGLGDDRYSVVNVDDVVHENANEGIDTINSSVSYVLGANVENLVLTGLGAINATGNVLNNELTGNIAANVLDGGIGNDSLTGGLGADTYKFARGYGVDVISDYATDGAVDSLSFSSDIASNQLWFRRLDKDLEVSVIGGEDKVFVKNWYLGNQYQVEQFKSGEGKVLLNSQVDALVNAMAAFSPPVAGQSNLSSAYQNALAVSLSANWK